MIKKVTLAAALLLTACAVGPDFHKPAAPTAKDYTAQPVTLAADSAQRFVQGDLPAQWWTLFKSEPLNRLIKEAIKANPEVDAAQASLKAARENVYAQQGAYFPSLNANFSPSRQKTASQFQPVPNSGALVYNLFTAQVNVSYAPDVFGLNRRTVESLDAQAEVQRFQLEATYLTLTSNVVAAAVQEASIRSQIAATQHIIESESQLRDLFTRQEKLGQSSSADTAAQDVALAQAQQALPPLEKQLAQTRDQLIALLGRLPSDEPSETFELSSLHLPEEVPLSLPAKLVEQRPDIRSAEAALHVANAQVGVAIANRLPNITLDASAGSSALALSQLFNPGTGIWALAGGITQPVFDGGTLMHKERAARAELEQAQAQYRSTIVTAFQNVADTLHALDSDAKALNAANNAESAARRSLDLVQQQVRLGAASFPAMLAAQQAYQQAVISVVQAQANRYADTAALFQALGGGWWNRADTKKP